MSKKILLVARIRPDQDNATRAKAKMATYAQAVKAVYKALKKEGYSALCPPRAQSLSYSYCDLEDWNGFFIAWGDTPIIGKMAFEDPVLVADGKKIPVSEVQ